MGSSQTRDRTRVPGIGRRILNHCVTREAPTKVFNFGRKPFKNGQQLKELLSDLMLSKEMATLKLEAHAKEENMEA